MAGRHQNRPAEFGRENASACVTACFEELLPNVEDACRQLQQPEYQRTRLWDLYCCDSINCGVYIGNIGESPNVDLIINECQNIGFFSIEDPGPPATNYCASPTLNTIMTGTPLRTQTTGPSLNPELRTRPPDSVSLLALPPTQTPETFVTLIPTSTSSPTSAKVHPSRLTEGAKAAIGVFSVIAVLAIAAFLFFLFRWRRRRSPRSSSPGPLLLSYDHQPYPGPRSGSQTPLITPPPSASSSRGTRLTPPAKLSDRSYLQPVLKKQAPRPLALSGVSNEALPLSPIRSPEPIRQHARRATTSNLRLPTDTRAPTSSRHPQSSVYSSGSGPGASTTTIGSNKGGSVHSSLAAATGTSTPPSSAMRLPQAHDRPLEPSGPPPNRALPAPPPNHPQSPTFSVTSVSPRSPTFPLLAARSLARSDGPIVPTKQQRNTTGPPASITTKELCDLTESYAQETRESWGSWSGVGGGGPGVVPLGRIRGSAGKDRDKDKDTDKPTAVAMQELDLEKLSGRY